MNQQEIKTTVIQLLKNIAPDTNPELLAPDQNIRQTLGIDSFDYLLFVVSLDEHFGIQTPEEDYNEIETIDSLLAYLQKKIK